MNIEDLKTRMAANNAWKPEETKQKKPISVMVPLSVETEHGKVRVYIAFDGVHAENCHSLMDLLEEMIEEGMPVDVWKTSGWKKKNWR